MNKITCRFQFECPKKWADLQATDNENIRFCATCEHDVYLAKSQAEFDEYANCGKCVAIEICDVPYMGKARIRET